MNYEAFFQLSYGLYIVSSKVDDNLNGYIGNTVFQVTAEPPTLAVSVNKKNLTHQFIEKSNLFSVCSLGQTVPTEIIQRFGYKSGNEINKFEDLDWESGKTGAPVLPSYSTAFFECRVIDHMDVGTHTIFIGKIVAAEKTGLEAPPLTYEYYRTVFKGMSPENAPTYIDKSKLNHEGEEMAGKKYTCSICRYEYDPEKGDPEHGIAPGTAFEDLPEDWVCPVCGAEKDKFE